MPVNSKNKAAFLVALIFLLALSSCKSPAATSTGGNASSTLTPLAVLTPSSGLSVVGGLLLEKGTQKPPQEGYLYLGEVSTMTNGEPIVHLERSTAPYAYPASNGEFVFMNVKPGKYGLVYYTPEFNFLIDNPKGAGSMIFDVTTDQVIDLGTVEITLK
jgi:hypothetical protein